MNLAEAIEYIRNDEAYVASLAELAEVREVLEGLRTINGCWCSPMVSASLSPLHHSEPCQRTSVLYQKLRTDK